jgi:hypothetical protein
MEHMFKNIQFSSGIPVVTDIFRDFTASPKTCMAKSLSGLTFI